MVRVTTDLTPLARKYVWWKTPEEAVSQPERVIAQVMNIGDFEDARALHIAVGDAVLTDVLRHAEIGQFSPRSWAYWHYRLGLARPEQLPPMPTRQVLQDQPNTYCALAPVGGDATTRTF